MYDVYDFIAIKRRQILAVSLFFRKPTVAVIPEFKAKKFVFVFQVIEK